MATIQIQVKLKNKLNMNRKYIYIFEFIEMIFCVYLRAIREFIGAIERHDIISAGIPISKNKLNLLNKFIQI